MLNPPSTELPGEGTDQKQDQVEDQSLGEVNIPLSSKSIQQQMEEGELPPIGLTEHFDHQWNKIRVQAGEQEPDRIKNVANPLDYKKVEVSPERTFYLGKTISKKERGDYIKLLKEYSDVFTWTLLDLKGILPDLGKHHTDLIEGSVPVRQRQYRLNPKYSLMMKEEIDRLSEVGFIYPINNSEWVSPIVVVPKKVGADGKVKIQICQDFRKLNAAIKKDYLLLSFMDIILNHISGQECYSFLDGFSGYNQVSIRIVDQLKTTLTTEWRIFAFNWMPFGLCNAPGTFQRLMMDIFRDFLRYFLEVFIDDFFVFSKRDQHLGFL